MIIRVLCSVVCGFFLLALIAPYDAWVKYHVGQRFKHAFSQAMDCSIEAEVVDVNIIFPSLSLKNVFIKDKKNNLWHWKCKTYSTGFSWAYFLNMKMIDMWVSIKDMNMYSSVTNNVVHIIPHLNRIINPSSVTLPLQFKHFMLDKATLTIEDVHKNYRTTFLCNGQAKNMNNNIKMRLNFLDGEGHSKESRLFHSISGSIVCDMRKNNDKSFNISAQCDISATVAGSDRERDYFISGAWENFEGKINLQSDDEAIFCNNCTVLQKNKRWFLKGNASLLCKELLWMITGKTYDINGKCVFIFNGELDINKNFTIQTSIRDCNFGNYLVTEKMDINAVLKNKNIYGTCSGIVADYVTLNGSWNYDLSKKQGSCNLYNSGITNLKFIDHWYIKPQNFSVQGFYDSIDGISFKYDCLFSHNTLEKKHRIQGALDYSSDASIFIQGIKDDNESYNALIDLKKYPYLQSSYYWGKDGLLLESNFNERGIVLNCNVSLMRELFSSWFDRDIQAEGNITLESSFDTEKIAAHCELSKGTIRLPQTYNFIDGGQIDMTYYFKKRELEIKKIDASMHCGTCNVQDGKIFFDSLFKPSFIHIPLIFNRCLFTMKRDLFIMASGHLLFEQKNNKDPLLSGSIIIERGQIKENILSQEFQKQIGLYSTNVFTFNYPSIQTNISVQSRHGIKIDTPFLKTTAKISLQVKKTVTQPALLGAITLLNGSLQFPYKPLMIHHGIITFNPDKGYDPTIEFLARNQVRNHRVSLHITGSLLDHHIALESNPPLTDEQIIGLLLTGSLQESLKNMMPALIMNNLKSLIFGSNQFNFLNKYFKPLGNNISINLIPSFTDQYGRGGLRGALEVGVNDQWRALIQKNFSFTEDTRVELEYLFTDDITLRAVRDEQKNLGFEAEMRWKF